MTAQVADNQVNHFFSGKIQTFELNKPFTVYVHWNSKQEVTMNKHSCGILTENENMHFPVKKDSIAQRKSGVQAFKG